MVEAETEKTGSEGRGAGEDRVIEVKDLSYTYPGGTERTIRGISFSIGRGEIFGFLGPSGAGRARPRRSSPAY